MIKKKSEYFMSAIGGILISFLQVMLLCIEQEISLIKNFMKFMEIE